MSIFLSSYKYFKSFKIPLLDEDKVEIDLYVDGKKLNNTWKAKDINLNFLTLYGDLQKFDCGKIDINISIKKLFSKKSIRVTGSFLGSYLSSDLEKQIILLEIEDDKYKQFVLDFVLSFKKSRLKKYLIKSSLEDREYNNEEISELVSLLKMGFQSVVSDYEEDISFLLKKSQQSLQATEASLYLINTSDNVLEKLYSTESSPTSKARDYRKGITGIVFSNGEMINIYKSKILEVHSEHNEDTESIMAVPIFNRFKDIIGVLEYKNKVNGRRFLKEDETTLSLMSILFSSFYQYYKPVHPSSNIKVFNPGLKKGIFDVIPVENNDVSYSVINKLKCQLESILINSNSASTLEILLDEVINSSHIFDWVQIEYDCSVRPINFKHVENNTILILKNIEQCNLESQAVILDLIDQKNIWIISTYLGASVNTELFNSDFYRTIAMHHVNFFHEESNSDLNLILRECITSVQNEDGYDAKVSQFEQILDQIQNLGTSDDSKEAA